MGSGWSENGDSECVCTQNGARLKLYLLFANTFAPGERILPIPNRFALITGNERQPLAVSLRHECVCVFARRRTTRLQSSVPFNAINRRGVPESTAGSRPKGVIIIIPAHPVPRPPVPFSTLSRVVNSLVPEVRMELNIFAI